MPGRWAYYKANRAKAPNRERQRGQNPRCFHPSGQFACRLSGAGTLVRLPCSWADAFSSIVGSSPSYRRGFASWKLEVKEGRVGRQSAKWRDLLLGWAWWFGIGASMFKELETGTRRWGRGPAGAARGADFPSAPIPRGLFAKGGQAQEKIGQGLRRTTPEAAQERATTAKPIPIISGEVENIDQRRRREVPPGRAATPRLSSLLSSVKDLNVSGKGSKFQLTKQAGGKAQIVRRQDRRHPSTNESTSKPMGEKGPREGQGQGTKDKERQG